MKISNTIIGASSEPCQASKMGRFAEMINDKTVLIKRFILDV